jgi:predicted HNH restriction endonuclease
VRTGEAASAYGAYIRSSAWRHSVARQAELRLSGFRCRICNRGQPEVRLEVHHRSYENFGREAVGDLTTLCSECHAMATEALRRRRYRDAQLPPLVDTPRVLRGRDAPPCRL